MRVEIAETLLQCSQPVERRVDPVALRARLAATPDADAEEQALVSAVAALHAGEAKAAASALAGASGPVADAIRAAAWALDRNWFPGDSAATLTDEDVAAIVEPPGATGDPVTDALVVAHGRVAAMTRTCQSIASGFGRFGRTDRFFTDLLPTVEGLRATVAATGPASLHGHLTLVVADLHRRAGSGQEDALWQEALHRATIAGDAAGVARCHTVRGDWHATPGSSPELLGFDLEAIAVPAPPLDVAAALAHYTEAARAAVDVSGSAAAATGVRVAYAHRVAGDEDAWRDGLADAATRAAASGDTGLVHLVAVLGGLATIGAGQALDIAAASAPIVDWVEGPGSASYGRGLARLCLAQAWAWRSAGLFVPARRALRLASELGAATEPALVARELAELYRQYFPLAAVVLALGDLDRQLVTSARPITDLVAWATLADRAMSVHAAATARIDAEAIAAGARRMRDVLGRAPTTVAAGAALGPLSEQQMLDLVRSMLEGSIADAGILVPLYAGRTAQLAGRADEAARRFADAIGAAGARGPGGRMIHAVALATAGRPAEALPIVDQLVAEGALAADHAVELYLGLDQPDRAAELAAGQPPAPGWQGVAQRAELAERTGGAAAATALAGDALAAFEAEVLRFGRDALRSAATDDPAAAQLYLTAVRAALADGSPAAVARAFSISDRCRSLVLTDLAALAAPTAEAAAALRAWRRCESRWAATFEEVAERVGDPTGAGGPQRLATAEGELDDAEDALDRVVPGVLDARRVPGPPIDVEAVASALPDDAVLVQYHAFGNDLVVWALDRAGLRVGRRSVRWRDLTAMARRFLADAAGHGPPVDARPLADLLLGPVEDAVAGHERLVVVPYGGLAAVPFHLLPLGAGIVADEHVVSSLPAASLAPARAGRPAPRLERGALVVGDPAYAPARGLRRLPGAGTEATTVARLLITAGAPCERLLGDAATENAVNAAAPGRSILHLATHGLLSERSPNRSALALAGVDELTVGDLVGLDLDTDLVVLSACDTGRGTTTLGGDVVGLVRAVLAAGARHVVVSLWPVDDQAGCLVMTRLYERLVAGDGVARALAAAAASVRGLDPAGRTAAYEALRSEAGADPGTGGAPIARDLPGGPGPRPDSPTSAWAPFVHIGL